MELFYPRRTETYYRDRNTTLLRNLYVSFSDLDICSAFTSLRFISLFLSLSISKKTEFQENFVLHPILINHKMPHILQLW